jgi:hypothetical protein
MIKNLLLESNIFGVTIFGDGATITNVPLMSILAASPNNLFALLEIVDCTDQMAKGGKKDVKYLSGIVRPLITWLEARAKSNIVDLIMFDGARNVQVAAKSVARYHPRITVCHGAEHVIALSENDQFIFVCTALFHALHCQLMRLSLLNTRLITLRICHISASIAGIYGGPHATRRMQCSKSTRGNIIREYLLGS